MHVAGAGHGVRADRLWQSIRGFELAAQRVWPDGRTRHADTRASALAMGDERNLAAAGRDGRRGVGDVNHERRAADGGRVGHSRLDTHILAQLCGRDAGGKETVNVVLGQPCLGQRRACCLCVQHNRRLVGNLADLVRFRHPHDGCLS